MAAWGSWKSFGCVVQRIVYYGEMQRVPPFRWVGVVDERGVLQDDIVAMLEGNWKLAVESDWDQRSKTGSTSWHGTDLKATSC